MKSNTVHVKKWSTLRDIPHEFFITIGKGIEPNDLKLFFDLDVSKIVPGISLIHVAHFDESIKFEELAIALDQMPSKSEARKNKWEGAVPFGYTEIKRKYHRFYILHLPEKLKLE